MDTKQIEIDQAALYHVCSFDERGNVITRELNGGTLIDIIRAENPCLCITESQEKKK